MKTPMLLSVLILVLGLVACGQSRAVKKQNEISMNAQLSTEEDDEDSNDEDDEENEVEIKIADLPQSIVKAIATRFPGAQLKEADKITEQDGTYFYDVEIVFQGKVLEVMYDVNGQMLGEVTEDD